MLGDFKCKCIRSWLICQPRGILTNRKCLPWSWVIAKVLAQNVNLTSTKRSVLFGNLNKRSTWRLGVAEEGTWNVLNSPYEKTKHTSVFLRIWSIDSKISELQKEKPLNILIYYFIDNFSLWQKLISVFYYNSVPVTRFLISYIL